MARGNLTRTESWDNKTGAYLVTSTLEVDAAGNVTRRTDGRGQATSYVYDPTYRQLVTQVTDPLGHSVSTEWNPTLGLPITVTDANGGVTRTDYDALGQKTIEMARHARSGEILGRNPERKNCQT